ncbi:predicted protein [Plenodomus lingam JN3]|uniref:Predicted protein n=1 Tax=Leptosphaeria maculans (strain JN3 / isolate v23.1.3 / race Av1-4-5-6-7-8) TaxID=985895 RepID=E5A9A2_LEPMJ|nr:predicted protein [Plenodomus lingam JN3]CBY00243.1 predicted protein [Plenodomus lingam JN3]
MRGAGAHYLDQFLVLFQLFDGFGVWLWVEEGFGLRYMEESLHIRRRDASDSGGTPPERVSIGGRHHSARGRGALS